MTACFRLHWSCSAVQMKWFWRVTGRIQNYWVIQVVVCNTITVNYASWFHSHYKWTECFCSDKFRRQLLTGWSWLMFTRRVWTCMCVYTKSSSLSSLSFWFNLHGMQPLHHTEVNTDTAKSTLGHRRVRDKCVARSRTRLLMIYGSMLSLYACAILLCPKVCACAQKPGSSEETCTHVNPEKTRFCCNCYQIVFCVHVLLYSSWHFLTALL